MTLSACPGHTYKVSRLGHLVIGNMEQKHRFLHMCCQLAIPDVQTVPRRLIYDTPVIIAHFRIDNFQDKFLRT